MFSLVRRVRSLGICSLLKLRTLGEGAGGGGLGVLSKEGTRKGRPVKQVSKGYLKEGL